ncbi:6-phosphogluconate dehydrogenase, decarboxylating [Buchnera aphidicola (Cinara kochiana kochiana)]|uniref:6-phosphogluconate dehydrogenase, decarboxylating n=1 Tax=Buchnera aphidicola (Cinara kochiana kochiana) TaxID=2518976 RepID=A0A451D5A3_9GAMM|nr:decarboxylating NADP(+)-dependent phosphogluconate dehydrogenase [Buchnera aphidicola]VFP80996.1 6-phosphogluconate dehydrogenase, decarboxylating [Buchnera aphidicola (Cinara kochiana kochiana)]
MSSHDIGIIGMGVMGKNLACNIANTGYKVSVFNRSYNKTMKKLFKKPIERLFPYLAIKDFINSLRKPRCVMLMIQSGNPVDELIHTLLSYLCSGDLIIDGGNSFYLDTVKRFHFLQKKSIQFLGVGISGGSEGALKGPSIMPGGTIEAYELVAPIFKNISAKYHKEECVEYLGPDGAGHYVKMVHNGIEYSDMQLIAETYSLLKNLVGMNNIELSNIFEYWNKGELCSYLIEITGNILRKQDEDGNFIIDYILDSASNKGTGIWTAKSGLDLYAPCSVITESVFARYLSSCKANRMIASTILSGPKIFKISNLDKEKFIKDIRKALFLGKIISYAQGFGLMKKASECYSWNLSFSKIAKIFRSGCIIRANLLNNIAEAYSENNDLIDLLFTPIFRDIINRYHLSLRNIIGMAVCNGISVPVFSAALSYYDAYRTVNSSANLIQAQRDYFGSHTYHRIDQSGIFHTDWLDK